MAPGTTIDKRAMTASDADKDKSASFEAVRFQRLFGRRPRVLHIGNIANNAYHNAKLLNHAGFDCDVICYDYYHVMSCPEWEDADFGGNLLDDFFPAWHRVELNHFKRPRWFAQGRLLTCLKYLRARRENRALRANLLWNRMEKEQKPAAAQILAAKLWRRLAVERRVMGILGRRQSLNRALHYASVCLLHPRSALKKINCRIPRFVRARASANYAWSRFALRRTEAKARSAAYRTLKRGALACQQRHANRLAMSMAEQSSRKTREDPELSRFHQRVQDLIQVFDKAFPDRADRLVPADFQAYATIMRSWLPVLSQYDLVIGYSTDPIIPMLAGRPYFALEHGTLRELPFEATPQGRLTALAYHLAEHVFVTNSDCLDHAHELAGDRVTFINHPYDDRPASNDPTDAMLKSELQTELDADHLVFFPTRHDWVAGTGYADKANDVFLNAFAKLRTAGQRVGLVCCAWGANVEHSRQLLADKGVAKYVRWIEPQGMVRFKRYARACGLVADQFKLGSFGGVLFKSLAEGVPCLTYLDNEVITERFGEPIPCLNVRTESQIVSELRRVFNDPDELDHLGHQSRAWIDRCHASLDTINRQVDAFAEQLLSPSTGMETFVNSSKCA